MEKFKLRTFEEFKKEIKPLAPPRILTKEEVYEVLEPMIAEQIKRILNPTEEEKRRLQEFVKELDEWDLEWELVLNNNKKTTAIL